MNYSKEQMVEAMMFAFNTFSDRLSITEVEHRVGLYVDGLNTEWDDSHELNNVMNKMVDDLYGWAEIDFDTKEYIDILFKTQDMIPLDTVNGQHCHHSDFDVDGIIYRLTWTIDIAKNAQPFIERKIN
jgi:hypothetical protein